MAVAVEPRIGPSNDELAEVDRLLNAPAAMDHVTTDLAGRRVLNDVTFPIERGKITVLIGPSGVGKTTIVKHLIGLTQPTYGRALGDGQDMRRISEKQERDFRRRLSVMLQGPSQFNCGLFASLNAFENVAFPLRERTKMSDEEIHQRSWAYLSDVGMVKRALAPINELSGGELRRIALARALVSESELVIIDDIESGIDHVRLRGIIELVERKQREQGNTYLITTHEPEVARRLADNLVVVRAGAVVEQGNATAILRQRDAFGRRLLEGDPASGLAMLDEVPESEHKRARNHWDDYDARTGALFMLVSIIATVIWSLHTLTAG